MSSTSAYKLRINTDSSDANALMLVAEGALVGILVELADECHGTDQGKWTIEAAFGIGMLRIPAPFPSAIDAANWVSAHVGCKPFTLDGEVIRLP